MTGQPNVIVVVWDTTRAIETVPADPNVTPTLATLAEEGTEYTNAFTSAPWTLPSHAALFTGTYSSKHGAHGDHPILDESLKTFTEAFDAAGYETVGVSNNTWVAREFGFDRGFETFREGWQSRPNTDSDPTRTVRPTETIRAAIDRVFGGNPLAGVTNALSDEGGGPFDDGAQWTTTWIERWLADRDTHRPFFLFANYIEPHIPYRPPKAFAERFLPEGVGYGDARSIRQEPRTYDVDQYDLSNREFEILRGLYRGEIAYLDAQLRRLVDALVAANEWEDTILVVTGDHGENIGDHGFFGHQYNVYDTLLHVPLVVHGGAFTGGAANRENLVQLLDLAPTLLDRADIADPRARERFQGRSFHPDADVDPREAVVAEYIAPQPSIATLEERYGSVPEHVREYDRTLRTIRTHEYKYVRGSDGTETLYRVGDDPAETNDIAERKPARVESLRNRLEHWRDSFDHADFTGDVAMTDATKERLADLGYL